MTSGQARFPCAPSKFSFSRCGFIYNITENPVHRNDLNATILHCMGTNARRFTYPFQGLDQRSGHQGYSCMISKIDRPDPAGGPPTTKTVKIKIPKGITAGQRGQQRLPVNIPGLQDG